MSEPPLCVVERWPPLAPQPGGDRDRDRDRPGPNSQRRCPAPRIPSHAGGPDSLTEAGQRDGRPRLHTDTPASLRVRVPVPGAASPPARRGQGSSSPGTSPATGSLHLSPASGSGSSPPPPGASSSRSSSPPLPCRACTARDSHRRLRGGRARPSSPPAPLPLPPELSAAPHQRLPVPPPDFSLLPRMRRPTRRLALSLLGVLWLAALLLFFFGARRKLEAAEPEGHTPEVRKGRRGRGCSGGTWARCRRRPGKKFPAVFGTPTPSRSPSKFGTGVLDLCLCRGGGAGTGVLSVPPGLVFPVPSLRSVSDSGSPSRTPSPPPHFTGGCPRSGVPRPGVPPAVPALCPAANLEHPRLPALGSGGTGAPQGNERRGSCHGWGTRGSFPPWITPSSRALP